MLPNEKEIKKKIITKRKDIKSKLDILKHGELVHQNFFSPLTKHLANIETELTKTQQQQQQIPKTEKQFLYNEFTPKIRRKEIKIERKNISDDDDDDDTEVSGLKRTILDEIDNPIYESSTPNRIQDITNESFRDYLEQYDSLPRKYIHNLYNDTKNEFDHKYGIRFNTEQEKFYIGDSELFIDGSDVIVRKKRYKGTPGLYELLFMKEPKRFTQTDEKHYQQIVLKTNANRRHYQHEKQIDGSRLKKYKDILAPLTMKKGGGGGNILMKVTNKNINYVHWDDANELVDRLKLLYASHEAGNTGVINEINSIIEELREAKIIH